MIVEWDSNGGEGKMEEGGHVRYQFDGYYCSYHAFHDESILYDNVLATAIPLISYKSVKE